MTDEREPKPDDDSEADAGTQASAPTLPPTTDDDGKPVDNPSG